jgi:magnesium-transporting ATPase (P-type)
VTSVIAGLSSVEASRRLAADGPNQLPEPRRPSALRHFGKQFTHLLAILLWVASGLALLAGQPPLAIGANTTIAGIAALTRQAGPPGPLTLQLNRV